MESSESSQHATFEDLGIPTSERENAQPVNTVLGQRRKWTSLSKLEVAFLIIAILSILSAMGLTIQRIVDILTNSKSKENAEDLTFAVVLLINTGFCLVYILNGIFGERAFELLVFVGGVLTLLVYCILNFTQAEHDMSLSRTIKLIRLILVAVFGPVDIVMGLLTAKQYYQSGNLIFRTVGANIELQRLYRNINLCDSLLKFDLQLQVTLVVLIIQDTSMKLNLVEILVLSIGLPFSIFYSLLGWLSIRFESQPASVVFFVASLAEPAYIIYKIVFVIQHWSRSDLLIQLTIIMASWAGLGIRLVLLIAYSRAFKNFGKGLKEKVYGKKEDARRHSQKETTSYQTLD